MVFVYTHCIYYHPMPMKTHIQKWGNSLAVRIPKAHADELRMSQKSIVDVSIEDGALVLRPVTGPPYNLKELLAEVTEANIHSEVDYGPACGNEAW
jgi:antitoxin MazE